MAKYRFDQIAINSTEKKKPVEEDRLTYLGLEHLDSGNLKVTRFGSEVAPIGEKLVMHKGDVLFGKRRAYQKKVAIAPFDGIFSAHGMVLRPKEDVIDKTFFPLFISSDYFLDAAIKISVGSLSPTINWRDLKELEFELPDLDTQRKLAKVLWSINETIEAYKRLILVTDELVKSQFIEMFGNYERKVRLGDCCAVHARIGWQALKKDEQLQSGEYLLVTGTDLINGKVNYSTCVYVDKERFEMDQHIILRENDVLITKDGTIGKVAVVRDLPKPATLNSGIFVVRPDNRFNKEFISYVFKCPLFEHFINMSKTGATIKHLNQMRLVEFNIPLPNMGVQIEFTEFVRQIDKSKFELEKALSDLTATYKRIIAENLG